MAAKLKKRLVDIELYGDSALQIKLKGRLLGLVTEKEYTAIINKEELRPKLFTVPTTPCAKIVRMNDVSGLRLAVALREMDGEPVLKKQIFFSEQLDMISHAIGDDDISMIGLNDSYILLTEVGE